jgi:hypothetical protein
MIKYFIVVCLSLFLIFPAFAAEKVGLYAYETSVGMTVGAVFGVLPPVSADDRLMSVTSSVCDYVEIHEMTDDNGIMRMRPIPFLDVGADKENKLDATGYHLMLMQLKSPLKNGEHIPLTLVYQKAGNVIVDVPVYSRKTK